MSISNALKGVFLIGASEYITAKIIKSGNVVEVYEYERGYIKGYNGVKKWDRGRIKGSTSVEYEDNRAKVLNRAKIQFRRLVNSNVGQYGDVTAKFFTLTFAENVQDLDIAHYEFTKFIKRLNYAVFDTKRAELKYSAAVEFQKRGAVHYHVIFYNLPYVPVAWLSNIWGQGNIWINKINNVDNVGVYVTKYMHKDTDDPRLQGRKCHFSSKGLLQPLEITDKKQVEAGLASLPACSLKYEIVFDNEYCGHIHYRQYNLCRLL